LSRSWALGFVRRAALPIVGGLLVFSWLLTGLTALPMDERAVYEAFGVPVSVLGPGLHLHLPWPFGVLRNVELGVVREIPIVFPSAGGETLAEIAASESAQTGSAEAAPPPSADRLWDASHPAEASYLIASQAGGQQSFEIVNIDLRIVYRTGLSDDAAFAAAYRVADPEMLIRAASGRMLVRHFSRYTLADVLGENRDRFVAAFKSELQSRLDDLHTGVEIIAVVVEAIHPPPAAATAYQNVQAAEINSRARVSLARGDAVRTLASAQQTALETQNAAVASAAEQIDKANADGLLFSGDREAHSRGGEAFLFERWLDRLSKSLTVVPLIVVDHRLGGQNTPTIDLRRLGEKAASDQSIIPEE
jgi:regulator of protease activity HflC (stomatin/prohibitin superfamily)